MSLIKIWWKWLHQILYRVNHNQSALMTTKIAQHTPFAKHTALTSPKHWNRLKRLVVIDLIEPEANGDPWDAMSYKLELRCLNHHWNFPNDFRTKHTVSLNWGIKITYEWHPYCLSNSMRIKWPNLNVFHGNNVWMRYTKGRIHEYAHINNIYIVN